VVTGDGKKQFEANVEDFVFDLTLNPVGDTFRLENSFVFSPDDEGVQFVPLLGGGANGKQRIKTLVEKNADTNEKSPLPVVSVTLEGLNSNKDAVPVFAGIRYAGGNTDFYASSGITVIEPGRRIRVEGERPLYLRYGQNGDFEIDSGGKATVEFLTDAQFQQYEEFVQGKRKAWTSSLLTIGDVNLRGNLDQLNRQYERAFSELRKAQKEERELIDRIEGIKAKQIEPGRGETEDSLNEQLRDLQQKKIPLHAKQIWEASRGLHGAIAIGGAKIKSDADLATLVLLDNINPHLYLGEKPSRDWFIPEIPLSHTEKEPIFAQKDTVAGVFGTIGYLTNSLTTTGEFLKEDQWGLRKVEGGGYGTRPPAFPNEDVAVRFIRGVLSDELQNEAEQQLYESDFSRFSPRNMNQQTYRAIEQALKIQLQNDRRLVGLSDDARDALIQYIQDTLKYYRTGNVDSYEAERELRKWDDPNNSNNKPNAEKKRKK